MKSRWAAWAVAFDIQFFMFCVTLVIMVLLFVWGLDVKQVIALREVNQHLQRENQKLTDENDVLISACQAKKVQASVGDSL